MYIQGGPSGFESLMTSMEKFSLSAIWMYSNRGAILCIEFGVDSHNFLKKHLSLQRVAPKEYRYTRLLLISFLQKKAYRALVIKFGKERRREENSAGEFGLYYDIAKKTKEEFDVGNEDDDGNALTEITSFFSQKQSLCTLLLVTMYYKDRLKGFSWVA